jgi:hypothetical protein
MQGEGTRLYRVRDVAGHFAVSVATIDRVTESGQLVALKFGMGTGAFGVSGVVVLADEQACAQAAPRAAGNRLCAGASGGAISRANRVEFTVTQRSMRSHLCDLSA